ncbi:hypothetical protein DSO57_1022710 [Entomophthora muscae]|uniref:Uncharacterized protein n=1 Tax=Entomophthora muscae TaxID=34485 RepID=A0ACC2RHS4_9FUNG|nr:hypothetical protein DSO57_1022710 [Entomophthora muscae]
MRIKALLEAAAECLLEVEVSSLRGALEDSNERICLSLFKIHYQIFMVNVRIDNSLPRETQAQGWDSNPELTFLRAAGPMDQGPARLRFFGIEPLQAEAPAKSQSQNTCTSLTMVAP